MSTFSWRTQPLSAAVTGRRLPRDPRRRTVRTRVVVIVAVLAVVAALLYFLLREAPPEPPIPGEPTPVEPTVEAEPAVLWAAGDIARCDRDGEPEEGAVLTAELIEQDDGIVAALGDLAYPDGTEEDFEECYDQTWGAFRDRTRPALGNHDDNTDEGDPYFEYFESLDMPEPEGWYSYELGEWHVIVLNSNCGNVGGCDEGDPQGEWLREELDQVDTDNILAYWHNPLFSAGEHGNFDRVEDLYEMLDEAGADVILTAHDHDYQRWAPQRADGTLDPEAPRQFVIGTGGAELRAFNEGEEPEALEYYQGEEHVVLRLELGSCGYSWEYLNVDGDVLDEGTGEDTC